MPDMFPVIVLDLAVGSLGWYQKSYTPLRAWSAEWYKLRHHQRWKTHVGNACRLSMDGNGRLYPISSFFSSLVPMCVKWGGNSPGYSFSRFGRRCHCEIHGYQLAGPDIANTRYPGVRIEALPSRTLRHPCQSRVGDLRSPLVDDCRQVSKEVMLTIRYQVAAIGICKLILRHIFCNIDEMKFYRMLSQVLPSGRHMAHWDGPSSSRIFDVDFRSPLQWKLV